MRSRRALVTGNTGFLGRHLVSYLRTTGYTVIPFSQTSKKDITRFADFGSLPRVDVIFHLAASLSDPLYKTNILGTRNVLEYAGKIDAPIIFASSYRPYPYPLSSYAISKLAGELLCQWYARSCNVRCTILRFVNLYGPGQQTPFIIPKMLEELTTHNTITLTDPDMKRDVLFVDDAVAALVAADRAAVRGCTVYTIGSGHSWSMTHIAKILITISRRRSAKILIGNNHIHGIRHTLADSTKAHHALGWHPTVGIHEGLQYAYAHRHHHT